MVARGHLPAELRPESIVAVVDTREQLPLDLTPLRTVEATLTTGDYSVRGLEHVVAIERKSLGDLLMYIAARRRWREARALVNGALEVQAAGGVNSENQSIVPA